MIKKYSLLFTYTFLLLVTSFSVSAEYISGSIKMSGGFFPIRAQLTGDLNLATNALIVDPTTLYGSSYNTVVAEMLSPGSYTRTYNSSTGEVLTRSATIPAGTVGAYFVINNGTSDHQLYMAWDVSANGLEYVNRPINGNKWIGGSFNGRTISYGFAFIDEPIPPPPPEPKINISVVVSGGTTQECAEFGGTSITANASVTTNSTATLDYIEWRLDGVYLNSGPSATMFVDVLDSVNLSATAYSTDGGPTATANEVVSVTDTTAPNLEIQFIDGSGNIVSSAAMGDYQIHFETSDICDPNPIEITYATAKPVMNVIEGDTVTIISGRDVLLPTTAIQVHANVRDANGRSREGTAVLLIEQ